MSDLNRALEALRAADAAGNVEDATRLAGLVKKLSTAQPTAAPEPQQAESSGGGFLGFTNRGIADTLGAPVDLVSAGLGAIGVPTGETPIGGSESIARVMQAMGAGVAGSDAAPEGVTEYLGRGVGSAAGALLPLGGLARGTQAVGGPVASGVAQGAMAPFVSTPVRAMGAEAMAGAGAGAGEAFADKVMPDSRAAQVLAPLVGGIVGGMGPAAASAVGGGALNQIERIPVIGTAARAARAVVAPSFSEQGSINRARERMGELASDLPSAQQQMMAEPVAGMSPSVQTGDPGLMALEQTMRTQSPQFDAERRAGEALTRQTLGEGLQAPGAGGDIAQTRDFIEGRVSSIQQQLDARIAQAEATAQQRISQIRPQSRPAASSAIVREEMENALKAARAEESRVWGRVPQDVLVPVTNSREAYEAVLSETPRALRDRISARAGQFLSRESNARFRDEEPVSEVHGLYSALREEERAARAAGSLNEARITNRLAEALMRDLESAPALASEGASPLRDALDYSRSLNETFRRGAPGRILSRDRQGGQSVAPESTLDVSTGRMGIPGAIATDEVLAAARNSDNAQAAMTDYLRNRFYATAFRDGELRPDAARKFMLDNAELMDRFPSLKQGFQAAADGVDGADATIATMQQRAAQLRDPRISTAAAFLKANPYEEIRALERQRNPRSSAAQLVRQARKDESGEALAGVKAALVDELMTRGRTSAFDDMGNPVLSGRAVEKALADRKFGGIAREVLSPEEMERTRRIIQELRKVETMQSAKPVSGGRLLDDAPSNILSFIVRTLGARQGAKLGAGTSGASMLTANFASRRAQALLESLTNDRAEAMLRRAIAGDRELYMSLLLPPSALTKKHESRLIETMIGLGANEIGGEDNAPQQ